MSTAAAPSPRRSRRILRAAAGFTLALAACSDSPSESAGDGCQALRLQVGQAADVQPSAECPLRAQGGAEYVLAYYDARLATEAQTQPEPYQPPDERFTVMVDDVTGGARTSAAPRPVQLAAPATPSDVRLTFAPAGPRRVQGIVGDGPWSLGDAIPLTRLDCVESCVPYAEARVARVFDGWLVLAVDPGLGAETDRVLSLFDGAVPLFRQHALPLLHAAFTAEKPVTSAASGQLVVVFQGDVSGSNGVTHVEVRPDGTASHWIRLETSPDLDAGRMLWLLAHEVAHAFQYEFLARTPPLAGLSSQRGGARWGIEGGATLADTETLRRAAGVPLLGNADHGAGANSEVEEWLYRNAGARSGVLTAGYYGAAPFLRDLVLRRMDAGDAENAAFREVLRGAAEGWYGVGDGGSRRIGLAHRMRARISGWDPADAVLTWTLSAAADDRTPNPVYQDRTWLRTSDWEHAGRGWGYDRLIQAGSGASERLTRPIGTSGYLLVRAAGDEVALTLNGPPTLRWKLLRVS